MSPATKRCSKCREVKSLAEFGGNRSARDGRQAYCKPCSAIVAQEYRARPGKREAIYAKRRAHYQANRERLLEDQRRYAQEHPARRAEIARKHLLKRLYGLTPERYDEMVAEQLGRCAICLQTSDEKLHVDHDHETGAVRGLLCSPCNTSLGGFKDDTFNLFSAIRYLSASRVTTPTLEPSKGSC